MRRVVVATIGTVCAGASVTLSGTSASSYSWDNSITDGVSLRQTVQQHMQLQVQMEMDV